MRKRIYSIGILLVAFCAVLVFGLKTEGTNVSETADSTAASEEADTADGQADFGDICKEEPSDVQSQEIEKDGDYWLLKWRAEATIEYDGKTVPAKYSDEVIAVDYTDDLSMLECADRMNHYYAYRDGKVYYRQYHEDSFAQSGLWGNYAPVPGTEKEMVCIDQAGVKSELFQDKGCGAFYLIGERFYMMEVGNLYSVDMEGQDRIDYGMGEIIAVDEAEHIILLERIDEEYRSHYCVLDCETGACKSLFWSDVSDERRKGIMINTIQIGWKKTTAMVFGTAGLFTALYLIAGIALPQLPALLIFCILGGLVLMPAEWFLIL